MAHDLKIAGTTYSSVSKVVLIDKNGAKCTYIDTDIKENLLESVENGFPIWQGEDSDAVSSKEEPSEKYLLWCELL